VASDGDGHIFQFCWIELPQEARLLLSRVDSEKPSEQNIAHFGPICHAREGLSASLADSDMNFEARLGEGSA
jgi:hypothetical protein